MKLRATSIVVIALVFGSMILVGATFIAGLGRSPDLVQKEQSDRLIEEGKKTFRFDTFGDEDFWGGVLRLHDGIQGQNFGGVGGGVSPATALAVGLKVDVDALPPGLVAQLKAGKVDLNDPAVTLALLQLNAVVGVKGVFSGKYLKSVGIQCALCHSTVDNSFAPGIGRRLDGWANRDLNVGAIVNLSPDLKPVAALLGVDEATVRTVLQSWGPGKFDAELFMDGKAFRPDGKSAATVLPPAFGLAGVNLHTYTGWGSVTYWNAFVANLEMHGKGTFFDPRLDNASQFPVAAKNGFGHKRDVEDLITPKLAALHAYQLSLRAPKPPEGFFDHAAAERGAVLFNGRAKCATCHTEGLFTEPGWNMHKGEEIGIDNFQSDRAPDRAYRTTPLKGLWTHMRGGFYHDGRFATLLDVVDHYNTTFNLALAPGDESDLVEYMKSLGDVEMDLPSGKEVGETRSSDDRAPMLLQNTPNPFNPTTNIRYELKAPGNVEVNVYSIDGSLVRGLVNGQQDAGSHSIVWDGKNGQGVQTASGVYVYRVKTGNFVLEKKMVLLK